MKYPFRLYASIPGVDRVTLTADEYLKFVLEIARAAEANHYSGALIHYNHNTLNPWMLAQTVIEHTEKLIPLIALQPGSLPPFTVVKMIETFAFMYGRKVALNVVAGAAKGELEQTGDLLEHDQRYERLCEYVEIIRALCSSNKAITYRGNYYNLRNLKLKPDFPPEMTPHIYMAGSSSSALEVALKVADVAVTHPQPIDLFQQDVQSWSKGAKLHMGIRIGIIARAEETDAWNKALAYFPKNAAGNIKTEMQQNSESKWIKDLAGLAVKNDLYDQVFWLGAYHSGKANCPYIVGNYDQVAAYLKRYLALGVSDILIDGPLNVDEFEQTNQVFLRMV